MDVRLFLTVFGAIFLAELGDKTQLALMAFAAENPAGWLSLLFGSILALTLTSILGVLLGGVVARYIPTGIIHYVAGGLFIIIGALMILKKL
jgi:putative Ca2+/H+ antiporter (TMEM165/GDT1 family)